MDVKEKVLKALAQPLKADYIRLENNDGISGFVVSCQFEGMSALDRQRLIEEALSKASGLTVAERRQVLMIAALTRAEYDAVGPRVRVHKIREMTGGGVEILLDGGLSDAEYVRSALNNYKGIETTEPKQASGANGLLMYFRAKGTKADPLTKEKAIRFLKKDSYIEVMHNA